MDEILTIGEMEARYPSECVLIDEPQIDEATTRLLAGKVLFHSPDGDYLHQKAIELRLPYFALRYLGTLPEGMELALSVFLSKQAQGRSMSKRKSPVLPGVWAYDCCSTPGQPQA